MDIAWTDWAVECLIVDVCDSGRIILKQSYSKIKKRRYLKKKEIVKFCIFVCKKKL